MMRRSGPLIALAAGAALGTQALAADLSIKVTLPNIDNPGGRWARPPYVAIWLRRADNGFAGNLAVWYEVERRGRRGGRPFDNPNMPGGARYLNELRQWWADSGNTLSFPVDGLTSASRAAGTYELGFGGNDPKLANLAAGRYQLLVEAAREHGGEESISIPFSWPAKSAQTLMAAGRTELGAVELTLKP
jgi:hypothetical protein